MRSYLLELAHDGLGCWVILAVLCAPFAVQTLFRLPVYAPRLRKIRQICLVGFEAILIALAGTGFVVESGHVRAMQEQDRCQANVRGIDLMISVYAQDWDNRLPPAMQWADKSAPTLEDKWLHCPSAHSPFSYAFNSRLDKLPLDRIAEPSETVLVFESDALTRNANGGRNILVAKARHFGRRIYGFADGHTKSANAYGEKQFRWQP